MSEKRKGKAVAGRTKPEVVTVGGKEVIVGGRWNSEAMADYVISHNAAKPEDWIKIGVLARIGCGSNSIPAKRRARARLSPLFMTMAARGVFLAINYTGKNRSAMEVKVADISRAEDRQNVEFKLDRMRKRKELSEEQYERIIALLTAAVETAGKKAA